MVKKVLALALLLSFLGLNLMATDALAKRGGCPRDDNGVDCKIDK